MLTRLTGRVAANQVNTASIRPRMIQVGKYRVGKYFVYLEKEINLLQLITALLGYET